MPDEKQEAPKVTKEGSLLLDLDGQTTTYEELKQKGTLQNYISIHFDGTHGELEEMEQLLLKL